MANIDKGRNKWGNNSQDDSQDSRLKEEMKGGRRGKPQVEIYRPGSGPLRKSAQGEEDPSFADNGRRPKSSIENYHASSMDDEIKPGVNTKKTIPSVSHEQLNKTSKHLADCNKPITSGNMKETTTISDKLGNIHISTPSTSNRHRRNSLGHMSSDGTKSSTNDFKKKSRKPEQALYIPKPLAQAIADRDVTNKSPVDTNDCKSNISSSSNMGKESRVDKDQRSGQMQFENWDEEQLSESIAAHSRMHEPECWDRSFSRGDHSRRNKFDVIRKGSKGEKEWVEKEPEPLIERDIRNVNSKYSVSLNSKGEKNHRPSQMLCENWDGDHARDSRMPDPLNRVDNLKRSKFDGNRKCSQGDKEWLEKEAGHTLMKQSNSNLNKKINEDKLYSSQYDLRTIRHLGTHRNQQYSEGDSRYQGDIQAPPWHPESPSMQNHQHRRNDPSVSNREIRQASEPRAFPPTSLLLDANRTRDTRSVEPMSNSGRSWAGEKLQAKPPSGRRGSCKDGMIPVNLNKPNQKVQHPSFVAPRFKKKYLAESCQNSLVGAPFDDTWDGSTVTFLGSGGMNYQQDHLHTHLPQPHLSQPHLSQPHLLQTHLPHSHSHLSHPHLPHPLPQLHQPPPLLQHLHSQSLHHIQQPPPPILHQQQFWSHTLPGSRARGRGRLRPEEVEMERLVANAARSSRSLTPDRLSALNVWVPTSPSSSQRNIYQDSSDEYMARLEDQRALPRITTPPPSPSSSRVRGQYQEERRDSTNQPDPAPAISPSPTHYRRRSRSNPHEPEDLSNSDVLCNESDLKKVPVSHQESSSANVSTAPIVASDFTISTDPLSLDLPRDSPSPKILDWSEEVERSERLEAERQSESTTMTRSWSLASLQTEKSQSHPPRERRRRRRRHSNKGGAGGTHMEGHEGSGTDDRSVSRDRNIREQNHDGNRGYGRVLTQSKPRDHTLGPSKDRTQRGPSRDRNQHGPSRDRNQRGPSRDRNQRGPSKDRNQRGPSKDCNQRGASRDQTKTQSDSNRDRGQRDPMRDHIQRDPNRDRTQCDSNKDRTNRDRTQRGPSRDRNRRGQSRGLSQERTHSRERSVLHERDRDRHREGGRRKYDDLERNDSWRERTSDDLEQNNRWREEPDRSDRRLESKSEGTDRNEKRRVSKNEMKDRGERRRGSKLDNNKVDRRRGSNHEMADRNESWRELKAEHLDFPERRLESKHENVDSNERLQEPEGDSKGRDTIHKTAPSNHVAGILVLPASDTNTAHVSMEQQELAAAFYRQLYDPNNPNKPIIVSAPSARAARENEPNVNGSPAGLIPGHPTGYGYQGYPTMLQYPDIPSLSQHGVELLNNSRPAWYDPYSASFQLSHNHHLIVDIERADIQLQDTLSSGGILRDWNRIVSIRQHLQHVLHTLLVTDIKFCQSENVEQYLWKILFYNIIELLRKGVVEDAENKEQYKKIMLNLIEEGTTYLENLLEVLEQTYKFKLDTFLSPNNVSSKGLGYVKLALVSAQKIFLFLGDLARYKEQINETSNFGKSRQCYIKAHQINPKNGRPYNQLAILAVYARRKLDAVYYYMRSLMASNPFQSARESLLMLFDESRKKYEQTEKRRREECEVKRRERMKEKEGAGKEGLRREYWVHPEGGRRRLHITTSTAQEQRRSMDSEEEELSTLSSVEVNKRFVTSYLNVHGKLFTKIGMETFQEAALQMLREFRALLQHSPVPLNANRFLQLLALNMFAIENTQLKETQMEPGYRSAVQESALVVSLQMFNLILEKCNSLLREQMDIADSQPSRLIVSEDMLLLLPAVKVWCDWLLCHSSVWNPPPSCIDFRVGPAGNAWSRLATLVNLLEQLDQQKDLLATVEQEGYDLVRLPEDATLSDFTPLMYNSQDPTYTNKETDMEVAQVVLRIHKVVFFGTVFLCGVDPPVLKLQKFESGFSEYISVVQASSQGSPTLMAEEQSDSELRLESFSEDEEEEGDEGGKGDSEAKDNNATSPGATLVPDMEIQNLLHRKEELERRHQRQERHRQRVQTILRDSVISVEIEVKPHHLVPDTNCFIDHLHQLQKIAQAGSGQLHHYTLMVPLVVLKELEGLARGGRDRDVMPLPDVTPEHAALVAECAKTALNFLRSKHQGVRCVTSKGTVLNTSTFTMEEDSEQDERNDDRILATCISLCRTCDKDQNKPGEPRRLYREVVLLTEDRNLRVKALARDVPVREVPDFMQWAGLG